MIQILVEIFLLQNILKLTVNKEELTNTAKMKPKNDELIIHQVVIKFHIRKVKKDNDRTLNQLNFDFFRPIFFNTIKSGTILKKIKNVIP